MAKENFFRLRSKRDEQRDPSLTKGKRSGLASIKGNKKSKRRQLQGNNDWRFKQSAQPLLGGCWDKTSITVPFAGIVKVSKSVGQV